MGQTFKSWADSIATLGVSVVVVIVLHILLLPPAYEQLKDPKPIGKFWLSIFFQPKSHALALAQKKEAVEKVEKPQDKQKEKAKQKKEPDIKFGHEKGIDQPTVEWISHDAFEQLLAKRSSITQAAQQKKRDAEDQAPLDPKPLSQANQTKPVLLPPVPQVLPEPENQPVDATKKPKQQEVLAESEPKEIKQQLQVQEPPRELDPPTDPEKLVQAEAKTNPPIKPDLPGKTENQGESPLVMAEMPKVELPDFKPVDQTKEIAQSAVDDKSDMEVEVEPAQPQHEVKKTNEKSEESPRPVVPVASTSAKQQGEDEKDKPTSAPLTDAASPGSTTKQTFKVQPGKVIVQKGLRIQTDFVDVPVTTRLTSLPGNPTIKVKFDNTTGEVVDHIVMKSSGYRDVDFIVVASLYRWKAAGPKLKELDQPFWEEVTLLMR